MKRLNVYRPHGGIEVTAKLFGWYFSIAVMWLQGACYRNGRKWIVLRPTRCLCAWFGPDMYDGCSECGR